jgi:hypothetical protein
VGGELGLRRGSRFKSSKVQSKLRPVQLVQAVQPLRSVQAVIGLIRFQMFQTFHVPDGLTVQGINS